MRRTVVGLVVVGSVLVAASCTDESEGGGSAPTSPDPSSSTADDATPTTSPETEAPPTSAATTAATTAPTEPLEPASFAARPGPEQLTVVDARPGDELEVVDGAGAVAASGTADRFGSLLFRELEPGDYTVRSTSATTGTVTVTAPDEHPDAAFYREQEIDEGFGYLKTRDGTTLSVNVVLPNGDGPFPTVVEYSGYQPSDPAGGAFPLLFTTLGYAYVGVNMRGTGCSGGSYRFFETAQVTDGYDVVEAVAAQPWVQHGAVGLVGVSYPGISQLFVGQTRPPSLAAITPLSVLDDSFRSTLYPGGLLNTGFALEWTAQRVAEARPRGQQWTVERIRGGDERCRENQRLRLQNPDLVAEVRQNPFYPPALGDSLAPRTFVDEIDVPVFLAGAFQDEQTGGRFPTMLDDFTSAPHLYASLVNGAHTESISAGIVTRYLEFLDLYVARKVPSLGVLRAVAPTLGEAIFGTDEVVLPGRDRFAGMSYREALAAFEAEPPIEVLFEQGGAPGLQPGSPNPRFVRRFDAWPIPEVQPTTWYLGGDGTLLTGSAPTGQGRQTYTADPGALPDTFMKGDDSALWRPDVEWDWRQNPEGTAASFASEPLDETTTMIGSASADLWISSDAEDTDLEVTLSEVRPDGQEVYVQSGWLRASHRALDDEQSTELQPVQSQLEDDAAPLRPGEVTPVRVEIFPFAHAFRAGSRLRLTIDAPGNSRAVWVFETVSDGERVVVAFGGETPSAVVLPVVPGVRVPAEYPTCTLKGQPCRPAPPQSR